MLEALYIYGCGEYGIETYIKLTRQGIRIQGFIDADSRKRNYSIDKVPCLIYGEIKEKIKKETCMIVALEKYESVVENLKQDGFKKVYAYKDFLEQYMTNTTKENQIEYSHDLYLQMINEFRYDIVYQSGAVSGDANELQRDLSEVADEIKKYLGTRMQK